MDMVIYIFVVSLDIGIIFDIFSVIKDLNLKIIEYILLLLFVMDGYGMYLLNFILDDGIFGIDVYKEVVLFYEEVIVGF